MGFAVNISVAVSRRPARLAVLRSISTHRVKHPHGEKHALQHPAETRYLVVILVFGPGIVLMGLAMSPHMDTVLGWLVDLVGGRQSARTIHFIIAFGFIGFVW